MSSIASQRPRGPSLETVRALVSRARSGDRTAFMEFYRMSSPLVTAYIRHRVPRHVNVEDLAQDVWTRAWTALPQLAHLANPLGWLYTIAHNVIATQARSAWVQRTMLAELPDDRPDPAPGPDDAAIEAADRALLARLVETLTDDQARVIRADLAEYSTAETAAEMGLTVGAVKSYRYRAMRRMRQAAARSGLTSSGLTLAGVS